MRANVYNNGVLAGLIEKLPDSTYLFEYDDVYINSNEHPSISLTLPKNVKTHRSNKLFAFFYGLLSEGVNKHIQCRLLKIDENDHFRRLLMSAQNDTIGAITIKPLDNEMLRML